MTRAFECILLYMPRWCAHADAADVLLLFFLQQFNYCADEPLEKINETQTEIRSVWTRLASLLFVSRIICINIIAGALVCCICDRAH
jgi:hypothetical protein